MEQSLSYPGESRDCETDTALVLVRIALDQGIDERRGSCDYAQVLVVEQVYDTRRPLAAGNDLLRGAEQAQQTECCGLLHYVHCVTDNITQVRLETVRLTNSQFLVANGINYYLFTDTPIFMAQGSITLTV